jgi:hypothetical protein
MTRHIYKVHASPFYDLSRDQIALPPWLARAMEKRTETKGYVAEPALARTPPLSSSPRSSSPHSSMESGLCTPSPLLEEALASQIKVRLSTSYRYNYLLSLFHPPQTSYFQNNFVPRTNFDTTTGGNRYFPPDILTLASVHQPILHHVSAAPDFTSDCHQYLAAPAPTFSVHHAEGPSVSTSPALFQSTGGSSHFYNTQDYHSGFSISYIAPLRNQFDERNVTQGVDYFDLTGPESFNEFSTSYLV